jgi:hypothetical protein
LPASEYLMTHAPQDAPYRLASDPRGSGNLLDGRSSGRQSFHLRVDRALPLQPFGPRQRGGIEHSLWRQRVAQPGQLGSDRLQKGCGRILEQMPAVGNLDRLRRSAVGRGTVARASVPADHFNLAVGAESGGNGLALAIRQYVDHGAPFEINDNASVTVAAPLGEVVNADHAWSVAGVGAGNRPAVRRMVRSSVSLEHGVASRAIMREPGLPPRAIPTACTT